MGEEWAASTPFLYFVDFSEDEALSSAVREGRRREFSHFKPFASSLEHEIPDPTLEETFSRSRLVWAERSRPPHAEVLAGTRRLLELRQAEIVPLAKTRFRETRTAQHAEVLDVTWHFEGGTLRFLANFGSTPAEAELSEAGSILWSSDDVKRDGGRISLPSWTGSFIKDAGR
jgi:maltooligosyltrehalose trehalohydrolase